MRRTLLGLAVCTAALPARAGDDAVPEPGPPPTSSHYLQYGVALAVETVPAAADLCPPSAAAPCILGSGGGLAIRMGYRSRGPWYAGGAYEFSRQDPSNLLRLAILQQLRAETRYYFDRGTRLTPSLGAGLGAVLYGSEWAVDTGGVVASIGGGLEYQLSPSVVVGGSLAYRPLLVRGWTDSAGQRRADRYLGFGLAHLVGFELVLEIRQPLARW
jgi:hypothetical protein